MTRLTLIFLDYIMPRPLALAWYERALKEIDPLHADVSFILQRIIALRH